MELNRKNTALVFGLFAALVHVVWSFLVMVGWARAWMDFVTSMHFLNNPFTVGAFSFGTALGLIAITFVVGCVVGWVFATLWNRVHRRA